jgi:polysaccharide export outer membrane protein
MEAAVLSFSTMKTSFFALMLVPLMGYSQTLLPARPNPSTPVIEDYVLGADDQLKIWALGFEDELKDKTIRIEPSGDIHLPVIGRVKAAGLTTDQLEAALVEKMKRTVRNPQVSVEILDYGSQPVSVLGAVNQGGVHQLKGRRTLAEVVSMAGGIRQDAGADVRVMREVEYGPIPLANAAPDATGRYSVAEIKLNDLLSGSAPAQNILIRPHDVVTIAPAETISVIGAVQKPGAFPMNTKSRVTVLEALAMAGGYAPSSKPGSARILRSVPGNSDRQEIAVDLSKITNGKSEDVVLRPNDILLVPTSVAKKAGVEVAKAVLSAAVGVAIWRPF